MASNEHDPDGVAGPARGKCRAQDIARYGGDEWVTPSDPLPQKPAVPPPPVPVPAPSGVHDTVESAWSAGSSVPVAPPHLPPKTPFPVPREATASDVHRVGLAVPGGVPTPLGDRVDRFDSQFPNLGAWVYLVRNAPLVLVMAARAAHTTSGGPCAPRRPDLPAPRPRQCPSHPSLSRTIADQSSRSLPRPPPPRRRVAI